MSRYVSIPSDRMQAGAYDADGDTFVDAAEGIRETGGPTTLAIGAVADGEVLRRNASTAVGIARAGVDTDATTHAAKSLATGHTGTLANLNTAITDTSIAPTTWDADLSGTYDWSANGDGSQDTTSGLFSYEAAAGDLAAATLSVGSNVITYSIAGTTDPADREVYLVARLDAFSFADLYLAQSIAVTVSMAVTALGGQSGDNATAWIADQDVANTAPTEFIRAILKHDGANRTINTNRESNNGLTAGGTSNVVNWDAASTRMTLRATIGNQACSHFDVSGNNIVTPAAIAEDNWHVRAGGANAPYLVMSFRGKGHAATPGTSAGTISAINVRIN